MARDKSFTNPFDDVGFCAVYSVAAFEANKNTGNAGIYAMRAIRAIAKAGGVIPAELSPWIDKACTAWESQKGIKVRFNSVSTSETGELAIAMMAALRTADPKITVEQAAEYAHESYQDLSIETLKEYWRKNKYRAAKENGQWLYALGFTKEHA